MRAHTAWTVTLLLPGVLSGCMYGYTPAGPTYTGDVRTTARLLAIAADPSDEGATEAVDRLIRHGGSPDAIEAVLACAEAYPGPIEARFGEVKESVRKEILVQASKRMTNEQASALIVRLSRGSGMATEGIAALKGRQDATAVAALLDMARGNGELATRVAAVEGLEPPDTPLARDALLGIARDTAAPTEVRSAAVSVLAPYADPAVREAMLQLVDREDSRVSARALEWLSGPLTDAERQRVLAATLKDVAARAAMGALVRAIGKDPLPPDLAARVDALVDLARPLTGGQLGARHEAGKLLLWRNDPRGARTLVTILDSPDHASDASYQLDGAHVRAVPALREGIASLGVGKPAAARILARYGGPRDAEAIRAAAAPKDRDALLAGLPTAPWGLFPDGTVTYALAATDATTVTHTLEQVVDTRGSLDTTGDPTLWYTLAARAWLAGDRSSRGTGSLHDSAKAARDAFGLGLLDRVAVNGDSDLGKRFVATVTERVRAASGVPRRAEPPAGGPAFTTSGTLACNVEDTTTRTRLPDSVHTYAVTIRNAAKDQLRAELDAYPDDQKLVVECTNECTYNPSTTRQYKVMMPCDHIPSGVDAVCRKTVAQVPHPAYKGLLDRYKREPDQLEVTATVPRQDTEVRESHVERCTGTLTLAVGAATWSAPVSWEGRSVRSRVEMRAQPVGPNDVPLAPWTSIRDAAQTDDVKQRFEEAVAGAIGPFAPREAEVRRMYADHARAALRAGDVRSARQSLIWSDPAYIATDVAGLRAFRALFLAADGFPNGWK